MWAGHTGGEVFIKSLDDCVVAIILAKNIFMLLLKSFITDVLKCFNLKFKCVCFKLHVHSTYTLTGF